MTEPTLPGVSSPAAFDDATYPAYTMSAAVAIIGVQPGFLRGLGEAGLLRPARSGGGHRRYSQLDLHLAVRARQLVDEGMTVVAACRIVALEYEVAKLRHDLTRTRQQLAALRRQHDGTPR